jgi:predicted NBD/HSP70 family sugar kinase
VQRPATPEVVSRALARAASQALGERRARIATVSAADPVDKATGRLVHLPDAPFLLGAMDPAATLAASVEGPIIVDNDVNWAARAEQAALALAAPDEAADDFVYFYLGEGIGCAVVADGNVRRGHHGLAGELAQVVVSGPRGATPLIAACGDTGLRRPGSTAIDVDRLLAGHAAQDGSKLARALAAMIVDVVDSAVSFTDPAFVVLGGPWGCASPFVTAVQSLMVERPRRVELRRPLVRSEPSLAGARSAAVETLRGDVVARSRDSHADRLS